MWQLILNLIFLKDSIDVIDFFVEQLEESQVRLRDVDARKIQSLPTLQHPHHGDDVGELVHHFLEQPDDALFKIANLITELLKFFVVRSISDIGKTKGSMDPKNTIFSRGRWLATFLKALCLVRPSIEMLEWKNTGNEHFHPCPPPHAATLRGSCNQYPLWMQYVQCSIRWMIDLAGKFKTDSFWSRIRPINAMPMTVSWNWSLRPFRVFVAAI